jgi:uncharacterized protein YciI
MTRTRRTALALAAALIAAPALAQAPAAPPSLYVCLYRAGPNWLPGKPATAQPLRPHAAYMKKLLDDGVLLAGGPFLDVDGGMAVVRARDIAAAKAIFAVDPAITAGVMLGEVRPWLPAFVAKTPLVP